VRNSYDTTRMTRRLLSALGYVSPEQFERSLN
jgi:hypothetical protein